MTEKGTDPTELWRKMIGEMEKAFNTVGNQATTSPEFSKLINQASGAAAGAQKQFGEFMEKWLLMTNLPSRVQMVGIAERLQTIENQLDDVKAMLQQMQRDSGAPHVTAGVRPPRTKRPPLPSSGERK
jgi:SMC interacting uncharacterized protein involved in chromosome segregation